MKNQTLQLDTGVVEISYCEQTNYQAIVKRTADSNTGVIVNIRRDSGKIVDKCNFYETITSQDYLTFFLNSNQN